MTAPFPPILYQEDLRPGFVVESAGVTVTESQILDFARLYDPQPIHIDVEAAVAGPYGGVIASGFQTLALAFRMIHDTGVLRAGLGSPGFDDLRWPAPVRAGDTLRARLEVLESRPSQSKRDRGVVKVRLSATNQARVEVLSGVSPILIRRRPE